MKKSLYKVGALFGAGILLNLAARYIDGFAEWYATTVYRVWVEVFGRLFSILPFSVAEGAILFTAAFAAFYIARCFYGILCKKKAAGRKEGAETEDRISLTPVFLLIGGLLLLFQLTCGINYQREVFSSIEGIPVSGHTSAELYEVCTWLTEKVNETALLVSRDEKGLMVLEPDVAERARAAMVSAGEQYPSLAGYYPKAKPVLCSFVLSYEQLQGVFCSYTMEPLYNRDMPDYKKPATICHELSHMRGFMREDEAGFIGYLACIGSGDADLKYSGYMSAYVYCMNALYGADSDAYRALRGEVSPLAEADMDDSKEFWNAYKGTVSAIADKSNDVYLKANSQSDGVRSYSRMVNLVIAHYEITHEL